MNRRGFLALTGTAVASSLLNPSVGKAFNFTGPSRKIKAVAFDAFPIFNPNPVFALTEKLFPGNGPALSDEWRTRQFEYAWLRMAAHHYADFWRITQDALTFAANKLKLDLTTDKREALMNAYLKLAVWPDVLPALDRLKTLGLQLAFLSNFTPHMLEANIKNAGLDKLFDEVISTDQAGTYKPDPRAYQLGVEILGLQREEIMFVAFAGWDAAGAKLFGYPTFWNNRLKSPPEELDAIPDASGTTLLDLVQFLQTSAASA
ncbi:MAG TPA: haloacid dehalogenase type II [Candidatus Angelobacter sp.]|nr:haloacid dehalogenase type II [Candidatus Angelobacter sp.]